MKFGPHPSKPLNTGSSPSVSIITCALLHWYKIAFLLTRFTQNTVVSESKSEIFSRDSPESSLVPDERVLFQCHVWGGHTEM